MTLGGDVLAPPSPPHKVNRSNPASRATSGDNKKAAVVDLLVNTLASGSGSGGCHSLSFNKASLFGINEYIIDPLLDPLDPSTTIEIRQVHHLHHMKQLASSITLITKKLTTNFYPKINHLIQIKMAEVKIQMTKPF